MKYGVIPTQPIKYRVFRALTEAVEALQILEDSVHFWKTASERPQGEYLYSSLPTLQNK